VGELVVTEAPLVIQDETSQPTVRSEEVTDGDDRQSETVTRAIAADEVTRQTDLPTGKNICLKP